MCFGVDRNTIQREPPSSPGSLFLPLEVVRSCPSHTARQNSSHETQIQLQIKKEQPDRPSYNRDRAGTNRNAAADGRSDQRQAQYQQKTDTSSDPPCFLPLLPITAVLFCHAPASVRPCLAASLSLFPPCPPLAIGLSHVVCDHWVPAHDRLPIDGRHNC